MSTALKNGKGLQFWEIAGWVDAWIAERCGGEAPETEEG
jgi:hypothetical protein